MTTSADSGSGFDAVERHREGLKPLNTRRYFNKSRLIHIILIDFFCQGVFLEAVGTRLTIDKKF